MSEQISRTLNAVANVTVDTTLAGSSEIPFEEFTRGSLLIPSTSGITQLTWYGAEQQGDEPQGGFPQLNSVTGLAQNYVQAFDAAGQPVTQTVAQGRGYPIPLALAGYAALKIVSNVAGTLIVCLKS